MESPTFQHTKDPGDILEFSNYGSQWFCIRGKPLTESSRSMHCILTNSHSHCFHTYDVEFSYMSASNKSLAGKILQCLLHHHLAPLSISCGWVYHRSDSQRSCSLRNRSTGCGICLIGLSCHCLYLELRSPTLPCPSCVLYICRSRQRTGWLGVECLDRKSGWCQPITGLAAWTLWCRGCDQSSHCIVPNCRCGLAMVLLLLYYGMLVSISKPPMPTQF